MVDFPLKLRTAQNQIHKDQLKKYIYLALFFFLLLCACITYISCLANWEPVQLLIQPSQTFSEKLRLFLKVNSKENKHTAGTL